MAGAKDQASQADKFMRCYLTGDVTNLGPVLDPRVFMICPMGIFQGAVQVKAWVKFDCKVIGKHKVTVLGTKSEDKDKTATTTWTVEGLFFQDDITLNQLQVIRRIRRTMLRTSVSPAQTPAVKDMLLTWTGPHFAPTIRKSGSIDNKALVLPILDFAYMGIKQAREISRIRPRDGKELTDPTIVYHFMEQSQRKQAATAVDIYQPTDSRDEITIRAKGKDGEQAAIVIDRAALNRQVTAAEKEVLDEEDSVPIAADRRRYIASGLKLCNNEIERLGDLDIALKVHLVNAFYFLTWIDLSSNKLVEIPDVSQYPIVVMYLHNNQIRDVNETKKLALLPTLQSVTLFGNPIQSEVTSRKDYKFKILNTLLSGACTGLKSFDHSVITESDKFNVGKYKEFCLKGRPRTRQ